MRYVDDLTKVKPEEICNIYLHEAITEITEVKTETGRTSSVIVKFDSGKSFSYLKDGRCDEDDFKSRFVFKPIKKVGYINIYKHNLTSGRYGATIFELERDARLMEITDTDYITTIKICWEE